MTSVLLFDSKTSTGGAGPRRLLSSAPQTSALSLRPLRQLSTLIPIRHFSKGARNLLEGTAVPHVVALLWVRVPAPEGVADAFFCRKRLIVSNFSSEVRSVLKMSV